MKLSSKMEFNFRLSQDFNVWDSITGKNGMRKYNENRHLFAFYVKYELYNTTTLF